MGILDTNRGVLLVSMTKRNISRAVLGILTLGLGASVFAQAGTPKPEAKSMLKSRPMSFVKNAGQWDSRALFGGHSNGMDFWVSKSGFVFQYFRSESDKADAKVAGHTVGMLFEGAKPFVAKGESAVGVNRYLGKTNSLATKYQKVRLSGIYDKIDAVAYFDGKAPRYDFVVKPGGSVSDINLNFKGSSKVSIVSPTKLSVTTELGAKFQEGLFAYQNINGKKVSVPVSFKQIDATHVGFSVGAYDKSKELVIDPLVYGTYYGGDRGWDEVRGVAADGEGNVYLTGYTRSPIYPVLFGPFGFNLQGGDDAFVSRLQGDVYNHDYSVLVAGTGTERGNFIRLDPTGNIWVVGSTTSNSVAGNTDPGNMWILRFAPDANTVLTPMLNGNPVFFRFGGPTGAPDVTAMTSLAIRDDVQNGNVRLLMTGFCNTTNGATGLVTGANSGSFYATLDYNETSGFSVIGGASGFAQAAAPATTTITGADFDGNGNFFLNGTLRATGNSDTAQGSPIFVTTPGVFLNGRLQRANDIWVRKFTPAGAMTWSALVGGASSDVTEGFFHTSAANGSDIGGTTCATDPQGNIYVLGRTSSFDFPRTPGVFGEVFNGGENYITVTKVRHDGAALVYSTNIRNTGSINASGIGVDSMGNAYITGVAHAPLRVLNPPPDPVEPGAANGAPGSIPMVNPVRGAYTFPATPETSSNDAWLLILNANASNVIRSTFIGGILDEGVFAPFVDPGGDVWVFGWCDTWRYYQVVSSTGTVTERIPNGRTGGLDAGFITNLAFKQNPEAPGQGSRTISGYFFDSPFGGEVGFNIQYHRDGFLLRFRESLPLLQDMTLTPATIPGGDPQGLANHPNTVGTITLSGPAPAGGATVKLTLNNTTVASFLQNSTAGNLTVIVPAGQTTATYNVYSRVVTAPTPIQVRANYNGNIRTASFTIVPWLESLTINGNSLIGGNSTTATIRLAANAPAGGVVVNIASTNAGLVSFPNGNTVTIPGGANQATFNIDTNGVDVATTVAIQASLLGVTRTADLGINPARLNQLVLTPSTVAAGGTTTGIVRLDGEAGVEMIIRLGLQGSTTGYQFVGGTVIKIPAGARESAPFTLRTPGLAVDQSKVVTAARVTTANVILDGPVTATLNVQALLVSSVIITPDTINSGSSAAIGTVTLTAPAPEGGARVAINSNKPGVALPVDGSGLAITSITIPEGATSGNFNIKGLFSLNGDTDVTFNAYRGPSPTDFALVKSGVLRVLALTYTLEINPSDVFGGDPAVGTITLEAPAIPGFTMKVTCDDPQVTFTQPVFTTGSATASFNIATPTVTDTRIATFSTRAGLNPFVTAQLTIRGTEVIGVRLLPSNRIRQGGSVTIEVTVNRNVTVATPGKITFSNPSLLVLPTGVTSLNFTVPVGSNKASVTVKTNRVPRNLSTEVTATVSASGTGPSASATLFVLI